MFPQNSRNRGFVGTPQPKRFTVSITAPKPETNVGNPTSHFCCTQTSKSYTLGIEQLKRNPASPRYTLSSVLEVALGAGYQRQVSPQLSWTKGDSMDHVCCIG